MATLGDLLATKGHEVIAVQPSDTVLQAANLMNDRNIGGVVVLDGDRLAGIRLVPGGLRLGRRIVAFTADLAADLLLEAGELLGQAEAFLLLVGRAGRLVAALVVAALVAHRTTLPAARSIGAVRAKSQSVCR